MAEPLKREQPSSSVATIFRKDVALAAVAIPGSHTPLAPPAGPPEPEPPVRAEPRPAVALAATGEPADVLRQFQLTASADAALKRVMRAYSEATGLDLNRSEFLRSLIRVLEHSIPQHEGVARTVGTLRRAKNDPWLLHKRDEIERRLARAIHEAFRSVPLLG